MNIALSGWSGSGKDELASVAQKHFGYRRASAGDVCKREVMDFLDTHGVTYRWENFHGSQADKLQKIELELPHFNFSGTFRELTGAWALEKTANDPLYFVRAMMREVDQSDSLIVTDLRMTAEAEYYRSLGFRIVRIERGCLAPSGSKLDHILDDYCDWDAVIRNDGSLDEFKQGAEVLLKMLAGATIYGQQSVRTP